eukprot:TRINITY_DN14505_c0_g1_i1.p1 TRINITY_DN14505_c0_g1~~TRINITY_DN14505_c0_g1_i1.p1  ORF type:complete len:472 (+),score=61.48 TRINITY_DN14505_c0_g1_i1:961-2376(+)
MTNYHKLQLFIDRGCDERVARFLVDRFDEVDQGWTFADQHPEVVEVVRAGMYMDDAELHRCPSSKLLQQWTRCDATNAARPPEYSPAADMMIIRPYFMANSMLQDSIRQLVAVGPPQQSFEQVLVDLIQRAFSLSSEAVSRNHSIDGALYGIEEACGKPFPCGMALHRDLQWRGELLHAALHELLAVAEEVTGLQILCAYIVRAAHKCQSQKIWAVSTIISRAKPTRCRTTPESEQNTAQQRLLMASWELVEEIKEKAFKSTFEEPTKMYFRAVNDNDGFVHVEVHASNWYLTLVMATLGVSFGRHPYMSDTGTWFADFLHADLGDSLKEYWKDEHLGRAMEALPCSRNLKVKTRLPKYTFVFSGCTPKEMANNAMDPSPQNQGARAHFAKYLNQFAHYFSEEYILERLWQRLYETHAHDLSTVFDHLRKMHAIQEEDVRFWIYDVNSDYSLNKANLRTLLAEIGIVHASE